MMRLPPKPPKRPLWDRICAATAHVASAAAELGIILCILVALTLTLAHCTRSVPL